MRRGLIEAFGYPVLPALYIVMAAWICVVLLRYKPQYTWPGLILVLLGVPVYLVWRRQGTALDVEAAELERPGCRRRTENDYVDAVCKEVDGCADGRGARARASIR